MAVSDSLIRHKREWCNRKRSITIDFFQQDFKQNLCRQFFLLVNWSQFWFKSPQVLRTFKIFKNWELSHQNLLPSQYFIRFIQAIEGSNDWTLITGSQSLNRDQWIRKLLHHAASACQKPFLRDPQAGNLILRFSEKILRSFRFAHLASKVCKPFERRTF